MTFFNQSYYQQTLLNLKLIEFLNIIEEINIKQTVRFFNINRSKTNLFQFFFVHFANRCRVNQRNQHLRAALPHHVLQIVRQKFRRVPRVEKANFISKNKRTELAIKLIIIIFLWK